MAQYKINTQIHTGHDRLIALPLTIITIFCFSFVLLQPTANLKKASSISKGSNDFSSQTIPHSELPAITFADPDSLAKLSSAPINNEPSANISSSVTATSAKKNLNANSLQSAGSNNHSFTINLNAVTHSLLKKSVN